MSVKLITFDLRNDLNEMTDYEAFHLYIEGHDHIKISETAYAFASSADVREIYEALKVFIDKTDTMLIITIKKPFSGRQRGSLMDWLNEHLDF